jgi:hypothetical protein
MATRGVGSYVFARTPVGLADCTAMRGGAVMRVLLFGWMSSVALADRVSEEPALIIDTAPISGSVGVPLNVTPVVGVDDPNPVIELRTAVDDGGALVETTQDRLDGDRLLRLTPAAPLAANTAYDVIDVVSAFTLITFRTGDRVDDAAPGAVRDLSGCAERAGARQDQEDVLSLVWSFGEEEGWYEIDLDASDGEPSAERVQFGNSLLIAPDDPAWADAGLRPAVRAVDLAGNAGGWTELDLAGPVEDCVTATGGSGGCANVASGPWWVVGLAGLVGRRRGR